MCIIKVAFPVSGTKDMLINATESTSGQTKEKWVWAFEGKVITLPHVTSSPMTKEFQDQ